MNARYQTGALGRFISQDPLFISLATSQKLAEFLADPQQQNSYSYARNNPLLYNDPTGQFSINIFGFLSQSTQVSIGNWANNNTVARYATDHPVTTVATLSIGGGAIAAGGVLAAGGSITCGIFCGGTAATVGSIGTAASSQYQKIGEVIESPSFSGGQVRQALLEGVQNQKLTNIITKLFQPSDKLPGGTAGAVRYTAETGKLIGGSNHVQKGWDSLRGLQSVLKNPNITNQERAITQTLVNQLQQVLSKVK